MQKKKSPVWQKQLSEQDTTGLKVQKRTTAVSGGAVDPKECLKEGKDDF